MLSQCFLTAQKENADDILHPAAAAVAATAPPLATVVPTAAPQPALEESRDTSFNFVLANYDSIQTAKVYSPWNYFGGYRWRLLIFPKGNQSNRHLSVYLECGGPVRPEDSSVSGVSTGAAQAGKGTTVSHISAAPWTRPAKFWLHIVHPTTAAIEAAAASAASTAPDINQQHSVSHDPLVSPEAPDPALTVDSANPPIATATHAVPNVSGLSSQRADIMKETVHVFKEAASDWGFLEFAPFAQLVPGGYADANMSVTVKVRIRLVDHLNEQFNAATWDSRKETGYVGFKNQGATCYMNSLLQTLYMVNAFRQAVYNMPLPEPGNENSGSLMSYALQKVFYELQTSPTVVRTKKLTESFGWDNTDAFTQHDVQELNRILCDHLEERMKKIAPDQPNTISTLFQGKLLNYIECVNVDFKSTREENFYDLSLNVKGCRNIYESFQKYTEVEMMEGDNKYRANGIEELQVAKKGVKFLKLPPVLQLHLKRFEYDLHREAMVKINDRYEFTKELNLCPYVDNSDGSDIYVLHSVLVHIGDVNGGHYHVFIRPEISDDAEKNRLVQHWLKFDDETVTLGTEEHAVQENFGVGGERELNVKRGNSGMDDDMTHNSGMNGGQTPPPNVFQTRTRYQARRFSNAYMLQYLRKDKVPYLLKPVVEGDVPRALAAQITTEHEEEEQRQKDRKEQHLYMTVAVATDSNMVSHHGADLVQWDRVHGIRVKRAIHLGELKMRLQNEGIIPSSKQMRLWKCGGRRNDTIRPDSLVANGEDDRPICDGTRDTVQQPAYNNVSFYSQRHYGNYGEDITRMYAEDFCSVYSLGAGVTYNMYWEKERRLQALTEAAARGGGGREAYGEGNGALDANRAVDGGDGSMLSADTVLDTAKHPDVEMRIPDTFPLHVGEEVLLFLKYYTPTPCPRLQWLGHIVVNRMSVVQHLHDMLKIALVRYAERDPTLAALPHDAYIDVYEEVAATNIVRLSDDTTLEAHRIPYDVSVGGDILVFQESLAATHGTRTQQGLDAGDGMIAPAVNDVDIRSGWDGMQEPSRADGTDFPLGGRPLPTVGSYFEYLAYRIKIEFKDKFSAHSGDDGKAVYIEILRKDTYYTVRKILAGILGGGADPDYLRFFPHDYSREAPAQEPARISDGAEMTRILPMHTLPTLHGQPDYRILWYEHTEYRLSEFEHKDEVRVVWRPDGGVKATPYAATGSPDGSPRNGTGVSDVLIRADGGVEESAPATVAIEPNGHHAVVAGTGGTMANGTLGDNSRSFSVLVPMMSKYADVIDQVRIKLRISSTVGIRLFEVKNSKIFRFINPADSVPRLMMGSYDCGAELRAEPIPPDETPEALGSEYELVTVLHMTKDKPRIWRGPTCFGVPFVIRVRREGETVVDIRATIQQKLGVPDEEFEKWPLAEVIQLKVLYLHDPNIVYSPSSRNLSMELSYLAIEHKNTAPPRKVTTAMSRFADKPLKIRS